MEASANGEAIQEFYSGVFLPARGWFEDLLGAQVRLTPESDLEMIAIAGQESGWVARAQAGHGPAHGLWQFEEPGGVAGVLEAVATRGFAEKVCQALALPAQASAIWSTMVLPGVGDKAAFAWARLLLWSDKMALPAVGSEEVGWEYYLRNWRPGAPSRSRWGGVYPQAMTVLGLSKEAKP